MDFSKLKNQSNFSINSESRRTMDRVGSQIDDSDGDLTYNHMFHKMVKLELELGILENMVH